MEIALTVYAEKKTFQVFPLLPDESMEIETKA